MGVIHYAGSHMFLKSGISVHGRHILSVRHGCDPLCWISHVSKEWDFGAW